MKITYKARYCSDNEGSPSGSGEPLLWEVNEYNNDVNAACIGPLFTKAEAHIIEFALNTIAQGGILVADLGDKGQQVPYVGTTRGITREMATA